MMRRARSIRLEAGLLGGAPLVRVGGEIDLGTAPQLREFLLASSGRGAGPLIVDLSQVSYMDSSAVGTMVYVKRVVEKAGRRLVLAGLQPRVRGLFEITHLDAFFTIVGSVEEVQGR